MGNICGSVEIEDDQAAEEYVKRIIEKSNIVFAEEGGKIIQRHPNSHVGITDKGAAIEKHILENKPIIIDFFKTRKWTVDDLK